MQAALLALLLLGSGSEPARVPFEAMRAGFRQPTTTETPPPSMPAPTGPSHRVRDSLIGAGVGAVAGVVTCTIISNIAKDPGTGFSTCTTKGYLLLGLGGAGLGGLIGALISH